MKVGFSTGATEKLCSAALKASACDVEGHLVARKYIVNGVKCVLMSHIL